MACQVKRDKVGDVVNVRASNGKESQAYRGLLDRVDKLKDTRELRERFKGWEGKHIMPITNKRELALALYKQMYSPAFKSWMGDWSRLAEVSHSDPGNEYLINQLRKTVRINLLDQNGEPKDQALDKVLQGPTQGSFRQVENSVTQPQKASKETIAKVKEFLDRVGVNVEEVHGILINGQRIGATGLADPLNALIQVTQGNLDVALPEEAMHIAVELIQQKNPALFKQMMGQIGSYNLLGDVIRDYKGIKEYQLSDGKPDIPKLKKEAIAKVLAQTIIDKNQGTTENPAFLAQTRNWWEKILDFLKGLFNKAGFNPFEETAKKVIEGTDDLGDVKDLENTEGVYLQKDKELFDKIRDNDKNTAKVKDGFEVNGTPVRNTVEERVMDKLRETFGRFSDPNTFRTQFKQTQAESEENMHQDIKDILDRYIDDNNDRRPQELPHINPSALDPFDNTIYNTLEENFKDRLNSYPAGTKFFKYTNLFDQRTSTAGRADLLAVMPDGKIDILQFKMPDILANATDVPRIRQEAYNLEIEELRKILQNSYGVRRADFRLTRAIPIRAEYTTWEPGAAQTGYKVASVRIGNVNARLINDDTLLPIPSASETTGNERFDKFLAKLRGLVKRLAAEKVTPDQRRDKTNRITSILASIRKLQVQKKADQVLSSAAVIVKRQQERYTKLSQSIDKTDPTSASLKELNAIAKEILDEKDQVEIYSDLHKIFRAVFTDGTEDDKEILAKARMISDDAQQSVDGYWDLSVRFRTQKLAAKYGIRDEFRPEKNQTWYRRMVRSLSQSPLKAGAILWELVSHLNNSYHLEFDTRLENLTKLEDKVKDWMKGKSEDDLYKKILQMDSKGRWRGGFVQRYSKEFFTDLREAQEKGNRQWVLKNIDVDAYRAWYKEKHQQVLASKIGARVHEDDQENQRRIQQEIKSFEDTFDIDKPGGAGPNNYELKNFPTEASESDEFREIKKEPALLELYNYWKNRLEESYNLGMIEEHNGWSWFPNVRKNRIEKLSRGEFKGMLSFKGDNYEEKEAEIDPVTQKPIDEIHAAYVNDLGKEAQDSDGKYFDYSEKSMDIFKVMALWDREIVRFKLKLESEGLARMLHYTEEGQGGDLVKQAVATKRGGGIKTDEKGAPVLISNEVNAKYIKDHIDAVYYSKGTSDESDATIEIPVKGAIDSINKIFGREILSPNTGPIRLSGTHFLQNMNRYFLTKTLGINAFTAASNIFGGTVNTYINQGKYFNKMDVAQAEVETIAGRFWKDEESKKMAGLIGYFHPYLEDSTNEEIRKLSLSNMVKYLSSDHLFFMQRGSDKHVNQIIAMSYIRNAMVVDGNIVNMREYARKELGYSSKYSGTRADAKEFEKKLEDRVSELKKSPEALLNYAQVVDDHIEIPGLQRTSETNLNFRRQILEFIKDALGNTSREDLSLYKRNVILQSFFMFKNWIPRMLDVRGQSLKYNPGTQAYEWGRARMLGRAVSYYLSGRVSSLKEQLGGGHKGLVAIAKDLYREKQEYFAEQGEDFDMDEAEFIDMYIKGVRSELKELVLGLGLAGILVAARAAQPPRDDDPDKKNIYRWGLRAIDKFQDEVTFFYNPISFMDIVNGSTFPAVNLLVDIERFFKAGFLKAWYDMIGDEQDAQQQHPARYALKALPITKELMSWVAIFNNDFAREYGIKISSQNGSSR